MTCWDPLRKKEVAATPEETVRQWFISVLVGTMKVPAHMMRSEVSMKLGDKPFRADILIYDRAAAPLAVVECKRESVNITGQVAQQALKYNMILGVDYVILTNGKQTFCYRRTGDEFKAIDHLPDYEEMICSRR